MRISLSRVAGKSFTVTEGYSEENHLREESVKSVEGGM